VKFGGLIPALGAGDASLETSDIAAAIDTLDMQEPVRMGRGRSEARAATLGLRVNGVSTTPSGHRVYRMVTRDGHYVGRTNPTRHRARKGDVLKITASHLEQDATGDMRWTNPDVSGGYTDAPHSWRELEAIAADQMQKDGGNAGGDSAPGPAGDIPPARDEGDAARFPSGPTLEAVHVNSPLPNISTGYQLTRRAGRKPDEPVLQGEFLPVRKEDRWKQLVYGVVLEPNSMDSQNDFMLPKHVEASAHGYLKRAIRGTSSIHKLAHRAKVNVRGSQKSMIPVESFIAPVDFSYDGKEMIKQGSWVLVVHVEDPALWQDFLDGKYQAFSVGGTGIRRSLHRPPPDVPRGIIASDANNWDPSTRSLGGGVFI
jgi:hypothetical protein